MSITPLREPAGRCRDRASYQAGGRQRSAVLSLESDRRSVRTALRSVAMLLAVVLTHCPAVVRGDQLEELAQKAGITIMSRGESSGDQLKQSRASIPLGLLSAANQQRASKVLDGCTQYRRLPSLRYAIDEPLYRYLMEHPDVAVSTWRAMGISRFEMLQTGAMEYEARAVDGSEGIADILYQDASQTIFICDGSYHNVLLPKPIQAAALIWFRARYEPHADGCQIVTQTVDVFVRFPSAGVTTLAKVLTPVTNSMMDRNVFEISLYASMMSRAVRDEPEWIVQVAHQLDGVLPQRPGELIAIARQPRRIAPKSVGDSGRIESLDRRLIHSPQLLFFDPPKPETPPATAANPSAGQPAANGALQIIPATRKATGDSVMRSASQTQFPLQSDADVALQPAATPAGSTASDPAGASGGSP